MTRVARGSGPSLHWLEAALWCIPNCRPHVAAASLYRLAYQLHHVEERERALAAEANTCSLALAEQRQLAESKEAELERMRRESEEALARLRRESKQYLAEVAERYNRALEQQREEVTGSLEDQQRQKRRNEMGQRAIKRMANAGLARGWVGWHEQWVEATRQRQMLAAAGARLMKPQLVACFVAWSGSWQSEQLLMANGGHVQLLEEKERECEALVAAVAHLRAELNAALQAQASGAEREMERRKDELCRKAAKRMANQGLAKGWGAWSEMYEETVKQKRMLAAAAARLTKPQLVACFSAWSSSWQSEEALASSSHAGQLLAEQQAVVKRLTQAVERLKRESEDQLAEAATAQRVALARQRAQLTGSLEEQEKAKRQDELCRKAAKRMANAGLSRGWSAWQEQWEEAARQKRMLAAAGARLLKPKLVACFVAWTTSWQSDQKLTAFGGHAQLLAEKVSP